VTNGQAQVEVKQGVLVATVFTGLEYVMAIYLKSLFFKGCSTLSRSITDSHEETILSQRSIHRVEFLAIDHNIKTEIHF